MCAKVKQLTIRSLRRREQQKGKTKKNTQGLFYKENAERPFCVRQKWPINNAKQCPLYNTVHVLKYGDIL